MDVLSPPETGPNDPVTASRRHRRLLIGGGAVSGFLVVSVLVFAIFQPVQVLPRIRVAPAFHLVDQTGASFTSEDLRGRFVLVGFTYGDCTPPCTGTVETMREVADRLGEVDLGNTELSMIVISVDPEHDTPQRLPDMAREAGAVAPGWRIATVTDPRRLKTLVGEGFRTYYQPNADGTIDLDPSLILVDGWGVVRGEYRYETPASQPDRILRHLAVLAGEVRNADGPARLAYEAAHLFLCYAD